MTTEQVIGLFGVGIALAAIAYANWLRNRKRIVEVELHQYSKQLEASKASNERLFQQAQRLRSLDSVWLFDLDLDTLSGFTSKGLFQHIRKVQPEGTTDGWSITDLFTPEDLMSLRSKIRMAKDKSDPQVVAKLKVRKGDNQQITAIMQARIHRDQTSGTHHLTGSLHDIEEVLKSNRTISEKKEELTIIHSLNQDGVVLFNGKQRVNYANKGFMSMTGLTYEECLQMNLHDIFERLIKGSTDRHPFPSLDKLSRANNEFSTASDYKKGICHLNFPKTTIVKPSLKQIDNDKFSCALYLRDITLESMLEEVKSQIITTAVHELRTPMASIQGYSEFLLSKEADPALTRQCLQIIQNNSQRIAGILDDFLDLQKIESSTANDFNFEPADLKVFVEKHVNDFKPPEGKQAPVVTLTSATCMLDIKNATRALCNVISNAYKYSGPDVVVTIDEAPALEDAHGNLRGIRISDNGIGMTFDEQNRIFERFFRADKNGTVPGTGLGMSLVKEIMDRHGGRVTVSSRKGLGTSVCLYFAVDLYTAWENTQPMPLH